MLKKEENNLNIYNLSIKNKKQEDNIFKENNLHYDNNKLLLIVLNHKINYIYFFFKIFINSYVFL